MTENNKSPQKVEFKLKHPIITGTGATYEALTFRRMKAKDSLVAENEESEARAGYMLFAELAGIPLEDFLEIDIEDLARIESALAPLMGKQLTEDLKNKDKKRSSGAT